MNDIWKSLASRLSEAEDLPRRLDYSTLPKTTDVIDEEKSVRWNREEVERRRKEWIVKRNTLLRKRNNCVWPSCFKQTITSKPIYPILNDDELALSADDDAVSAAPVATEDAING